MDLIDNFNTKCWAAASANEQKDFAPFRIASRSPGDKDGQFKFAIFDENGDLKQVYLNGSCGKKDPLNGIGNVELKLSEDGKTITGVIIEDECVIYSES